MIDSFILLAKGKESSFLQTFHHSGSVLIMWMLTASQVNVGWMFVLFNSFIHTVMYFYYTLTCFGLRPKMEAPVDLSADRPVRARGIDRLGVRRPPWMRANGHPQGQGHERLGADRQATQNVRRRPRIRFFVAALAGLFVDFARRTYGKKLAAGSGPRVPRLVGGSEERQALDHRHHHHQRANETRPGRCTNKHTAQSTQPGHIINDRHC